MVDDCPTPGKKRHPNEAYALNAALSASGYYGKPMRAYACPCGGWHTTSLARPARPVG